MAPVVVWFVLALLTVAGLRATVARRDRGSCISLNVRSKAGTAQGGHGSRRHGPAVAVPKGTGRYCDEISERPDADASEREQPSFATLTNAYSDYADEPVRDPGGAGRGRAREPDRARLRAVQV